MTDLNKNRNFLKDSLNLVIDTQTGAVLASAPSITAANAMMMFFPNLKMLRLPTQIMAAGRGEFLPIDPIEKAKNRRIEVIISPNLNELFEIISTD